MKEGDRMRRKAGITLFSALTAMVALADVAALSVVTNGTTLTVGVPEGQEYVFPHRLLDTAGCDFNSLKNL